MIFTLLVLRSQVIRFVQFCSIFFSSLFTKKWLDDGRQNCSTTTVHYVSAVHFRVHSQSQLLNMAWHFSLFLSPSLSLFIIASHCGLSIACSAVRIYILSQLIVSDIAFECNELAFSIFHFPHNSNWFHFFTWKRVVIRIDAENNSFQKFLEKIIQIGRYFQYITMNKGANEINIPDRRNASTFPTKIDFGQSTGGISCKCFCVRNACHLQSFATPMHNERRSFRGMSKEAWKERIFFFQHFVCILKWVDVGNQRRTDIKIAKKNKALKFLKSR